MHSQVLPTQVHDTVYCTHNPLLHVHDTVHSPQQRLRNLQFFSKLDEHECSRYSTFDKDCVCVQARDMQKMLKLEEEMDRRPATVV